MDTWIHRNWSTKPRKCDTTTTINDHISINTWTWRYLIVHVLRDIVVVFIIMYSYDSKLPLGTSFSLSKKSMRIGTRKSLQAKKKKKLSKLVKMFFPNITCKHFYSVHFESNDIKNEYAPRWGSYFPRGSHLSWLIMHECDSEWNGCFARQKMWAHDTYCIRYVLKIDF